MTAGDTKEFAAKLILLRPPDSGSDFWVQPCQGVLGPVRLYRRNCADAVADAVDGTPWTAADRQFLAMLAIAPRRMSPATRILMGLAHATHSEQIPAGQLPIVEGPQ